MKKISVFFLFHTQKHICTSLETHTDSLTVKWHSCVPNYEHFYRANQRKVCKYSRRLKNLHNTMQSVWECEKSCKSVCECLFFLAQYAACIQCTANFLNVQLIQTTRGYCMEYCIPHCNPLISSAIINKIVQFKKKKKNSTQMQCSVHYALRSTILHSYLP